MVGTIDMQSMRYLNMFNKVSRVPTKYCFKYNNTLVFAVPKSKVTIAMGPGAKNAKALSAKLGQKVKIVGFTENANSESLSSFISNLVDPVTFTKLDLRENEITITGGRQARASLIGRNRIREKELLNRQNEN